MSLSSSRKLSTAQNATAQLPAELYYPICAHVASRRDLLALVATARVFQRPSETALHNTVVLDSRVSGRRFMTIIRECPRFAPLVRDLRLELSLEAHVAEGKEYWSDMRDVLGSLSCLESLIIDDGRDAPLSWILFAVHENRLKVLRCAFILDAELLTALQRQIILEELSWTGALVSLPLPSPDSSTIHHEDSPRPSVDSHAQSCKPFISEPDALLISVIRQYLPSISLPRLKYIHSESLALARSLVPDRAITHLWVPGASFTAAVSSDYIYRHLTSVSEHNSPVSTSSPMPISSEQTRSEQLVQLAGPRLGLTAAERSAYLCAAVHDFGLSKGPMLSLRMTLDLPQHELTDVLTCIAQELSGLRALGFLPASALDPANDGSETKSNSKTFPASPLPYFKHLHTICLWSTPSRRAVCALESSLELPAIHTLACLHFSPAFEWLCLPVNDSNRDMCEGYHGGIHWKHEMGMEGEMTSARRRLTAVHDPENLLWRDV